MDDRTKIAALVSGGGTNLQAIIDNCQNGNIKNGVIALVLADKPDAYALERAKKAGIKTAVVCKKDYPVRADFEQAVIAELEANGIELVVLAGFMVILGKAFTSKYPRRIINVHPALIPSFCGEGYFGLRVHEAALAKGVKVTGATVHFVNEIPDGGEIIMQKAVNVLDGDTPEILQKRVMEEAEWIILPQSVEKVSAEIRKEKKKAMNIYEIKTMGETISGNPYVGRGIVIGTTADGSKAAIAYFIMGRSANSRNRIFTVKNGEVFTEPFDASKVADPSLIIYAAVRSIDNKLIVTNGDQTDTIYDFIKDGKCFCKALKTREFEPDAPNFTPRISGIVNFGNNGFDYKMSILKSIDAEGSDCARYTFDYPSKAGLGHFIHTYVTDGNPIPTFQGEPERVSVPNDIDEFTNDIWNNLDEANKISLYVRYTDVKTGEQTERIINKNK